MLPKLSSPAKVDKFPGLKGYPSHFGIDVVVTEEQCKSMTHRIKFLMHGLPPEFITPAFNLLGYLTHIHSSVEEGLDYFRTVLRYDVTNIVATSNMAHSAFIDNRLEDSKELESRISGWLNSPKKNKYVSRSHVDIGFFYFFVGLTCASMYHCSTAISLNPNCNLARFYYTFFSYLSDRDISNETQFHNSSLNYVLTQKPACQILSYLKWAIETKGATASCTNINITDKLYNASKDTTCPVILLYLAQELYTAGAAQFAVEVVEKSLDQKHSAEGFYLLARSLKHIYDTEMAVVDEPEPEVDTVGENTVQVIIETQHESKHQSSALMMSVRSCDQQSVMSGHSSSKLIELSPKGSFINQSSGRSKRSTISKYNEEEISDLDIDQIDDSPVDPKLVDIFDAVRCSCLIDTYDVSHVILLSEMFILCRHVNEAIMYLHDVINRGSDIQKYSGYLRLATCYIELKKLEYSNYYLKKYSQSGEFEVSEEYMCLVVKLTDKLIKNKRANLAKEWMVVMESNNHPSAAQFAMRVKRLVAKDKGLLDTDSKPKKVKTPRKKTPSSASTALLGNS